MAFRALKYCIIILTFVCCTQADRLTVAFDLPEKIKEASALETVPKSKYFWTLEDSGNGPKLFALDKNGKLAKTVKITNADNYDWEELASDSNGNLYIGDFGNNDNARKDLCIYKIDPPSLLKDEAEYIEKISFYYPEQADFPPKKSGRFYDAEAFFYLKGYFYIINKNRGDGDKAFIYKVPAIAGNHAAERIGFFTTCGSFRQCGITGADISDDGKKIVLLSNRKIWLVENFKGDDFANGKITEIDLNHHTQLEGICFKGKSKVYLVDERDKFAGGKVYEMKL